MNKDNRRAEQVARQPFVDGVTGSGLPRRPPLANLLPGAAAEDFGGGRSPLSREPEDVRGRLERFANGRRLARMENDEPMPPRNFGTGARTALPGRGIDNLKRSLDRFEARRAEPARPALPTPPPGSLSPLPKGWDRRWGGGWRSFRPGR